MGDDKRKGNSLVLRRWGTILTLVIFIVSFSNVSSAIDYPTKPIQVIITFPPGGGADTFARILVNKLSALLGQPVVLVNKPGGRGFLALMLQCQRPQWVYHSFCNSASCLVPDR
jgi:tripartite-type tricarboxylate transporter receptor subunit TctC